MTRPLDPRAFSPGADLGDLLLAATNDGVVDWDVKKQTARYSVRWKMLLGYEDHELEDSPDLWRRLTHPADLPAVERSLEDSLENLFPFLHKWRMRHRRNDWRWFLCRAVIMRDEQAAPQRMVSVYTDLTEQVQAEERYRATQRQLMEASHLAGMAEVASSVLHNVGNVLNSVNVSAATVGEVLDQSPVDGLERAVELLRQNWSDLGRFVHADPRGSRLLPYLEQLCRVLVEDRRRARGEVELLQKNIDHIKMIVTTQQTNARSVAGATERLQMEEVVEDAIKLSGAWDGKDGVELLRDFGNVPEAELHRHKLLQIVINLLSNARHAVADRPVRQIHVRLASRRPDHLVVEVEDTGKGIPQENLAKIFNHGFTTRPDGHGFGLHGSALAAAEMGGTLVAHSAGAGQGARFTLELPLRPPRRTPDPHVTTSSSSLPVFRVTPMG